MRYAVQRLRPAQLKELMAPVKQGSHGGSLHIEEHGMPQAIDLATIDSNCLGHLRRAAKLGARRSR